ncbi:MAG TPA: hypothetical protein VK716_09915 [Terracidiphilus sp.]|nr:hypothetical protein [Terracidiphilus sp.]
MSIAAKGFEAHVRIAGDFDFTYVGLRAGDDVKGNVDELIGCVGREFVLNDRFVEAVVGENLAHAFFGCIELGLGEASAGLQPAGALELGIDGCALGAVDANGPNEGPGRSLEDESDAIGLTFRVDLNVVEESGGINLSQASRDYGAREWRPVEGGKAIREGIEASGIDAIKTDAADRQALKACEISGEGFFSKRGFGLGVIG